MHLKKIIMLSLLIIVNISYAIETCPSLNEIKQNTLRNFKPYDLDNGTAIANDEFRDFQKAVSRFELAEWMQDASEGEAHCYYSDANSDGPYLNVYLAKYHLTPNSNTFWFDVGSGVQQCRKGLSDCTWQ